MHSTLIFIVVGFFLCGIQVTQAANWAVLVAGSNQWYNYRHQADVCHAYQILHKNGIPDSNIVVMMYDDIANNSQNPTQGVIINHPKGDDVYHGVPKDYTGATVTPQNFINVLLGNKTAMQGIGSGKVLQSGPDDNVFVYFTDHGATGLVAFPTGVLYAKDLNTTIATMYTQKLYKQMVLYIEACESGSMLENILPDNINIYATTASNAEESSYACYYDEKRATYLGDCYSVAWMENSDEKRVQRETLAEQYTITKRKTKESHVMEYGDLELGKTHHVDEFQGTGTDFQNKNIFKNIFGHPKTSVDREPVATVDVRIEILTRRLAASTHNNVEQKRIQEELLEILQSRKTIHDRIKQVVSRVASTNIDHSLEQLITKRLPLTEHDCYKAVTQYIHQKCFDLQNEFVLNKLWMIVNLCEIHSDESVIKNSIDQTCPQRLHFNY